MRYFYIYYVTYINEYKKLQFIDKKEFKSFDCLHYSSISKHTIHVLTHKDTQCALSATHETFRNISHKHNLNGLISNKKYDSKCYEIPWI